MSLGGAVGNAVFFFLSGYGLMQSDRKKHLDCWSFVKHRLSKVYFPVLLVTALWLPVSIYFHHYAYKSIGPLLQTFVWGFNDGALWFVKAIILLYAVFYLFTTLYRKNRLLAHIVFLVLFVGVCYYCYDVLGSFTICGMPAFYIGMLCSLNQENIMKGIYLPLAVIIAVMLVVSYLTGGNARCLHTVIDYGVIAAIISFCIYEGWSRKFCFPTILGLMSFDVYLIHNKVLKVMTENMDYAPFWLWLSVTLAIVPVFYLIRTGMSRLWK